MNVGVVVYTAFALIAAAVAADHDAPAVEVHYAPAENLERLDVAEIEQASQRIDLAAYVLTDVAVIAALTDAANRGVNARVYRNPDEYAPRGAVADALAALKAAPGVAEKIKPGGPLMHLKSWCVDGVTLRSGAANFSASGEKQQDNDLVLLRGEGVCAGFEAAFAAMWKREE